MANKVWVLGSDGNGNYNCVIHYPTPLGNNSAGVSWVNVLAAAGLNTSVLTASATPSGWQQTTTEHDDVVAGNTREIVRTIKIDSAAANAASVTALVAKEISDDQALLARQYKWFGYNQAA